MVRVLVWTGHRILTLFEEMGHGALWKNASEVGMFIRRHNMFTSPGHEDDEHAHIGNTAMFQAGCGDVQQKQ